MTKISAPSAPIIRGPLTYDYRTTFGSPPLDLKTGRKRPTMTVPDMCMSVQEILIRYSRKQALPAGPAVVNIDADVSAYDHLDQFQKIDMSRKFKRRVEILTGELNAKKAKLAQDKQAAKFEREVLARVKAAELLKNNDNAK